MTVVCQRENFNTSLFVVFCCCFFCVCECVFLLVLQASFCCLGLLLFRVAVGFLLFLFTFCVCVCVGGGLFCVSALLFFVS